MEKSWQRPNEELNVQLYFHKKEGNGIVLILSSIQKLLIFSHILKKSPVLRYKHIRTFGNEFHTYIALRHKFYLQKNGPLILPIIERGERLYRQIQQEISPDHVNAIVCRARQALGIPQHTVLDKHLPSIEELRPHHVEDFTEQVPVKIENFEQ